MRRGEEVGNEEGGGREREGGGEGEAHLTCDSRMSDSSCLVVAVIVMLFLPPKLLIDK